MDLEKVKRNLEKRQFSVHICKDKAEAVAYLNAQIDGVSVGFGGSVTLKELNIFDSLSTHNEVWWHNHPKQVQEHGDVAVRKLAENTQVYLSSVNGLSEDGKLVNIDGRGNRIAATADGHERVYFIVGKNKIAPDLEGAIWRARNIAAPKNAQRLCRKTPCAVKGDKCYDCSSPERICRGVLIMEYAMSGQQTEVVLVDEELGY